MKPIALPLLSLLVCVALTTIAPPTVAAPVLSKAVTLKGHGGASLSAPDWKISRADAEVTILERSGAASRGGFTTLVMAVEEGPRKTGAIDWSAVRENILNAAKGAGSNLSLTLKGSWTGASGFQGQRLAGTMRSGDRDVTVEMVALITSGVMVTVTAIGAKGDATLAPLAEAVARTASRPTPSP